MSNWMTFHIFMMLIMIVVKTVSDLLGFNVLASAINMAVVLYALVILIIIRRKEKSL